MEYSHCWQHHHPPVRLLPSQAKADTNHDDSDCDSEPHTFTTRPERRKRFIPKASHPWLLFASLWWVVLEGVMNPAHAFVAPTSAALARRNQPSTHIAAGVSTATTVVTEIADYANYAPAATSLFNNMKLPAAVVTAGMISLGFATSFPVLPAVRPTNQEPYPDYLRARCESLQRLHIVVALIAVTSEIVVVLWSAVAVNQLTEKSYAPAWSVWDLLQRDCDLAWSAVNSHFVLGIIGFVTMLALRAYVMLLAVDASSALMTAASTGTGAALCLMLSIVNRGVESGGGDGYRYGTTIYDLFEHYGELLYKAATSETSPGPLQLSAIVLEIVSLVFMANVLVFQNGQLQHNDENQTEGAATAMASSSIHGGDEALEPDDDDECPLIDIVEVVGTTTTTSNNGSSGEPSSNNNNSVKVVVGGTEPFFASTIQRTNNEAKTRAKVARCLAIEEETAATKRNASKRRPIDDEDTSVSIY